MGIKGIHIKINQSKKEEIKALLEQSDNEFIPPLSTIVNISDFSDKIRERAITFEAFTGKLLVGIVAAYFNDRSTNAGYITIVCVLKNYHGRGIAKELVNNCIQFGRNNRFTQIGLEVSEDNLKAFKLYQNLGFIITERCHKQIKMTLMLN